MLLNTIIYAALAQSLGASAATQVVTVAQNNLFQFTPNQITAAPGDVVAFNFVAQNHSVATSNANTPCQPERNAIYSDFQPVAAQGAAAAGGRNRGGANRANRRQAGNTPVFMVPITDTQPIYVYCSQAQHCQQGMVMVINPPNDAAVTAYQAKAAKANNNISPKGGVNGGVVQNNAAGTNPRVVVGATAGDAAPVRQGGKAPVANKANTPKAAAAGGKGGAAAANPLAALVGGGKGN